MGFIYLRLLLYDSVPITTSSALPPHLPFPYPRASISNNPSPSLTTLIQQTLPSSSHSPPQPSHTKSTYPRPPPNRGTSFASPPSPPPISHPVSPTPLKPPPQSPPHHRRPNSPNPHPPSTHLQPNPRHRHRPLRHDRGHPGHAGQGRVRGVRAERG